MKNTIDGHLMLVTTNSFHIYIHRRGGINFSEQELEAEWIVVLCCDGVQIF